MSGRATSAGVLFQSEVGAFVAALLLTERPLSRFGDNLPGKPLKIFMESPSAVDDVNVVTDIGLINLQAKTSLSLSDNPDSELGSVFDQFVRQYRSGVPEGAKTREMDVARDRLVLVVGENAPATIRNDLREALTRNRTDAATALPAKLKNALNASEKLIADVWLCEEGSPITPAKSQEILKLCSVAVLDSSLKVMATDALKEVVKVPGSESNLFNLLTKWGVEASQNGTGGDKGAIMRYLHGQISMKEPPSYQKDVDRLKVYSQSVLSRLERFTKINTDAGEIRFSRPVSTVVLAGAKGGSLAITGDPGTGKSGVIHELSEELSKEAFVVTLTVESNITTLDTLQKEIGLEHPILEVLKNIPIETKGYLVLDALDATRGGPSELVYRKLIQEVFAIPNWQVVASVRSFDLKLGLEWKKLFRGTAPDSSFSDSQFPTVRHVHVPLLGEVEIKEIEDKSPSLKIALAAGGSKIATLAKNPFNLSLIGELISGGLDPASLVQVGSRSELLSRYWNERLGDIGLSGTVAMKKFVELTLSERSVDIPETEIPQDASTIIEKIEARGVLVTEQTGRIAFRHHILFDFAVSKLILQPNPAQAVSRLSKAEGAGLLIAPSLEYWLEHLKLNSSALEYWKLTAALISSENTDPVIRVEVARIVVQSIAEGEDLSDLAKVLSSPDPQYNKAILQIAGSLSTYDISPETSEAWSQMISGITGISEPYQFQSLKVIIYMLLETTLSSTAMEAVGKVSRMLFDEISKDDRLIHWLSSNIIPFVAKTYGSNPEESKKRIEQIIADERFKKFGYFEVPALADEAVALGAQDDGLVADLFRRVFAGGEFSNEHATGFGPQSWIMSLRSNAAQDFHMSEYVLSTSFLELINNSPKAGARALGAAIDAKERRWQSEPDVEHQVAYKDGQMPFKEDRFAFSAWDGEFGGDGEENIYRIFQDWTVGAGEEDLKEIPDIILSEGGKVLAWKAIFEAGAKRPDVLGSILWNSAIDPVVLSSINTRQAAIALIAATYPLASEEQRKNAEKQILAYDFSHTRNPEYYAKLTIRSVFDAIGESNLASEQARYFLKAAREEEAATSLIEPADSGQLVTSVSDEESKVVATPIEQDSVASLSRSVRSIMNDKSDESLKVKLWPEVTKLLGLIDAEQAAGGGENDAAVAGTLAKALGLALKSGLVPVSEVDGAVAKLLEISRHNTPRTDDKTEVDFARAAVWSGNSARVDASEAIGKLIEVPHLWPKIGKRYQELLHSDPHPAVRMNAIIRLLGLWEVDRDAIWEIADKVAGSEQNSAVLAYAAGELARLKSVDVEKVEPVFVKLTGKKISTAGMDNVVPATIAYFAVVKGLSASKEIFQQWIANFKDHESEIQKTLFSLREYFVAGYAGGREQESFGRKNVMSFLWELIGVLEPFISNWPNDREPTDEELAALKLFTQIGKQLYFASAYKEGISLSLEEQRVFLAEYGPIISKLTTLGSPKTVHDCLQVLEKFIEADPVYCFELISEAMLRKSGVAKYEYERMGAELFVKLVGLYLADYRYIFADQVKRNQLIDCLAVFVEAGWREARRLFQTLPDLR
ncbi:hypothetical protein [Pedobacter sp. ASV28]|uniref:hypothetical protein n=1 Tax=Pedobacter sp. ASV28 TaxID=2795123 RepID=UPI0018EE0B3B|nr:hypothetical protein [Pedobacter sp. ASV28]